MSFKPILTQKGYSLFDVASAFQKSVRRGLEEEAMYWAVELFNSKLDEFLWKRIRIISSEDVGLAEPNIAANIAALYASYKEQKKKKEEKHQPERLFLTHAVIMLCRAQKSRLIDWALIHFWNSHPGTFKEVPEWAYDKHTQRGKTNGRGWEHFFEDATRLEHQTNLDLEDWYKELAYESIKNPPEDPDKKVNGQGNLFASS